MKRGDSRKFHQRKERSRFPFFIEEVEFVVFIRNETFDLVCFFLHFANKRLVEKGDLLNFERIIRYVSLILHCRSSIMEFQLNQI